MVSMVERYSGMTMASRPRFNLAYDSNRCVKIHCLNDVMEQDFEIDVPCEFALYIVTTLKRAKSAVHYTML